MRKQEVYEAFFREFIAFCFLWQMILRALGLTFIGGTFKDTPHHLKWPSLLDC